MTQQRVDKVVIALGSNLGDESMGKIALALEFLRKMGQVQLSEVFISQDITQKTERVYHNACAMLILNHSTSISHLCCTLKAIERQCGRLPNAPMSTLDVPMDLDILAILVAGKWRVCQKRLPFHSYEVAGLEQIAPFLLMY